MTGEPLQVSPYEFVVRLAGDADREEALRKLGEVGAVEPLPAAAELFLVRLAGKGGKGGSPKRNWQRLQKLLGGAAEVAPVFRDQDQSARYPVGTVVVRFKAPPSDEELAQLAADHGLDVKRRNKYASAQVAFTPREAAGRYLPDLLERLQEQGGLVAVWPETLSAYTR